MGYDRWVKTMALLLCGICCAASTQAAELRINKNGLELLAYQVIADGNRASDDTVLMVHGGLAHAGMETMKHLQALLVAQGFNTLAINLSLGISHRRGMYDCKQPHRHRHRDALGEIDIWVSWLHDAGVRNIYLLGHSRGAGQAALYAAQYNDAPITAVLLLAPQTAANGAAGYQKRFGAPLAPALQQAQALIKQGHPERLMPSVNLLSCRNVQASAESFVSYYGPDPGLDSPQVIAGIRKPTLVLIAADDEVVTDLGERMAEVTQGPALKIETIDGSGHFFRDLNGDDAADKIVEFLQSLPAATRM